MFNKIKLRHFIIIVIASVIIISIVFSVFWNRFPDWLGIGQSKAILKLGNIEIAILLPEKTLWDWLVLYITIVGTIGTPIILFILGNKFQGQLKKQEQDKLNLSKQQEKDDLKENILQYYLDEISNLLFNQEMYVMKEKYLLHNIIEIKTQTTIRRLKEDSDRQRIIFFFLLDFNLIPEIYKNTLIIISNKKKLVKPLKIDEWSLGVTDSCNTSIIFNKRNFKNIYLTNANLKKTPFINSDLSYATLYKADFSWSPLNQTKFIQANLQEAVLTRCLLSDTDFSQAILISAKLNEAFLDNTKFLQANCQSADFSQATLSSTDFSFADLRFANFQKTKFIEANLNGSYLYETKFLNVQDLKSCKNWEKAIFTRALWKDKQNQWIPIDEKANKAKIQEIKNLAQGIVQF